MIDLKEPINFKYISRTHGNYNYLSEYAVELKRLQDEGWGMRYALSLMGISEQRAAKWRDRNIDFKEAWEYTRKRKQKSP